MTEKTRQLSPDCVAPQLREVAGRLVESLTRAGGQVMVAGGAVRDALRGVQAKDLDLEVYRLPVEKLEQAIGSVFPFDAVGRSFGVYKLKHWPVDVALPRRESKNGTGHKGFEVIGDPHMSHKEACARRDFTINAMMWEWNSGALIDPWNGLKDLEAGLLRHTSAHFAEDPLRVLRAMQFAARFEMDVHPATVELCATITPEGLPAERLWEEWKKLILKGRKPSLGLNLIKACGWVKYFPELQAMIGCPQDPEWHPEGDVWVHTLHCMDAWARDRDEENGEQNREERRDENKSKEWESLVVGLAVLLHDVGKPSTTQLIEGRWRSRGHDVAGVRVAEKFLRRVTQESALIEQVLPLVECHMRPRELWEAQAGDTAIRRLARKVGRIDRLIRVAHADMQGRPPMPADFPEGAWLQAQADRLQVIDSTPQPLVQGRHLIEMGHTPGPGFKPILEACYEAQLDGEFGTVEAGLVYLRQYLNKDGQL